MRKVVYIILALSLLLSLCACGGEEAAAEEKVDLTALYTELSASLPEMIALEGEVRTNMLGIAEVDCVQVHSYICGEGLRADELWLIEAADEGALERIEALARSRKTAKMEETSFYSPEQYAICEDGRIISAGLYLAFIVSPEADSLEAAFEAALK